MVEPRSKADEYREMAAKLRHIAEEMKSRDGWLEIMELVERFERLAERADRPV
jgi:hypothetical protein